MTNQINPSQIEPNQTPSSEDEDDYRPEGIPDDHGWWETCRDWIGTGRLDGIEGCIGIKLSFFGATEEQKAMIQEIVNELTVQTRELIPVLIKRKAREKKAALKAKKD